MIENDFDSDGSYAPIGFRREIWTLKHVSFECIHWETFVAVLSHDLKVMCELVEKQAKEL